MRAGIFSIFSELHDPEKIKKMQEKLHSCLIPQQKTDWVVNNNFSEFDVILVCVFTGGSEAAFVKNWPELASLNKPMALLALTSDNSLPAALEIKSWLNQNKTGPVMPLIHGEPEEIADKLGQFYQLAKIRLELKQSNIGVIGRPSDWLIASNADYKKYQQRFGLNFTEIAMNECKNLLQNISAGTGEIFKEKFAQADEISLPELIKAEKIYLALKRIIKNYGLTALTLRCFDILDCEKTTGCLALAALNDEGIVAGCEADVPAAVSMLIGEKIASSPVFMANPASVRGDEAIFAHCTVPCKILRNFSLDSHFESGLGLAVAGNFAPGPLTLFKLDCLAEKFVVAEGEIVKAEHAQNLCRTQIRTKIVGIEEYLLKTPLGNHQIIIPGHHAEKIRQLLAVVGMKSVWDQPALP